MTWVMVDVEADGPIPGDYSMIEIGAVVVKEGLDRTFYGQLRPISDKWDPHALRVTRWTREQTMEFFPAARTMIWFHAWLSHIKNPRFVSDNNGFDWMFTCWYLHHFVGTNLFGHS